MKIKRSLNINSKAAKFLLKLDDILDLWSFCAYNQQAIFHLTYDGLKELKIRQKKWETLDSLRRLEKQKILQINKVGDRIESKLTLNGAIQLFRLRTLKARKLPKGVYCIVIFDIPESRRSVRDALRRFLKEAEFENIQRSVWRSKKDIFKDLSMLFTIKGASEWIQVFKAREV